MKTRNFALLIPCAVLMACGRAGDPVETGTVAEITEAAPVTGMATLASASGSSVQGELQLTATPAGMEPVGVAVAGEISGLTPGSVHGFHVHETGDCSAPDATSAGGHFNPHGMAHGGPTSEARHVGDLQNIEADESGRAVVNAMAMGGTLGDGGANDLTGKAIIVHEKADDYTTQPTGDSGARIACGVIR